MRHQELYLRLIYFKLIEVAMSTFSVENGAFDPEVAARRDAVARRVKRIAEAVYRLCEKGEIQDEEIHDAAYRLRMRFSAEDLDICLAALQAAM